MLAAGAGRERRRFTVVAQSEAKAIGGEVRTGNLSSQPCTLLLAIEDDSISATEYPCIISVCGRIVPQQAWIIERAWLVHAGYVSGGRLPIALPGGITRRVACSSGCRVDVPGRSGTCWGLRCCSRCDRGSDRPCLGGIAIITHAGGKGRGSTCAGRAGDNTGGSR